MAESKDGKQFLVLFRISPCTPARVGVIFPRLKEIMEKVSLAPVEQLFRSIGADTFGYLIRSKLKAGHILSIIETPQKDFIGIGKFEHPPLTRDDNVAVFELGPDFHCGIGFTRAMTWLQRH
jgi:hypothetical protein